MNTYSDQYQPIEHGFYFLFLIVVAVTVRLFFIYNQTEDYYGGLHGEYVEAMDNAMAGNGFVISANIAHVNEPEKIVRVPFIDRPLGYPFLMLPVYYFFGTLNSIRLFQLLLAVFSVLLIWIIGAELFSYGTGYLGALLMAISPVVARFQITPFNDAVVPFFILVGIYLMLQKNYWMAGLSWGWLGLIRTDTILLPLVLAFWLGRWKCWKLFLVMAIVLSCQVVRNYSITGHYFISMGAGINLLEGVAQFGEYRGIQRDDAFIAHRDGYSDWVYPNSLERELARLRDAWQIIKSDPKHFIATGFGKIAVTVLPDKIVTSNKVGIFFITLFTVILLADAFAKWHWLLVVPIYYIVLHMIFGAESRYFYPALPIVYLLAMKFLFNYQREKP